MVQKFILCRALLTITVILTLGQCEENKTSGALFNEQVLTAKKIAQKAGYSAESHEVVTQDGYIVLMDRIAGSKKSPPSDNNPAVLLVHGLLDASPTWLVAGPEKALGFILADEGYDVWLGSVRGTRYSRKHTFLSTSDPDYWNFSWNEIGIYDIPAMIDHIIEQTKHEKIFMVTHSQGGTVFFVMASERPEYQEKIIAHFSMVPGVFLYRAQISLIKVSCVLFDYVYSLTKSLGIYEVEPSNRLTQMVGAKICRYGSLLQPVCLRFFDLISGVDEKLNATLLPLIMQYWPAGAAIKQLAHFGQSIQSGKFRKFDYGRAGNIQKYNQSDPPDYNLRNITVPVHLFYATNDVVADFQDVLDLYEILPNATKFLVPCDVFAHADFVWGEDANTLVYNEILRIMARYGN